MNLYAWVKDHIVAKAVKTSPLQTKLKQLRQQKEKLARQAIINHHGGNKAFAAMCRFAKKYPKFGDLFSKQSYVSLTAPGLCSGFSFKKGQYPVSTYYVEVKDKKLASEILAVDRELERVDEQLSHLRIDVTSLIKPVRTVKKLLEIWPESEALLPEDVEPKKELSIDVKLLNDKIGL